MFNQSITAEVGQRLGSMEIELNKFADTFPPLDRASKADNFLMLRSAVGMGEPLLMDPSINFLRPLSIFSLESEGMLHSAS
jgi:hypothetical protein